MQYKPTLQVVILFCLCFFTPISSAQSLDDAVALLTSDSPNRVLARNLERRLPVLTPSQAKFYVQELKNRPEVQGHKIYTTESVESQKVIGIIQPVLHAYNRSVALEVVVIEQSNPLVGLYRESVLIFSTGLLKLLNDAQLRACVAHELAHECFIDELKEADALRDRRLQHYVEFKCDLLAAIILKKIGEDPNSIIQAVQIIEKEYAKIDTQSLEIENHPTSKDRAKAIELFRLSQRLITGSR